MVRVVGLADTIPLDVDDPFNPINRRISIIVLNKSTEEAIRSQTSTAGVEVQAGDSSAEIGAQLQVNGSVAPPAPPSSTCMHATRGTAARRSRWTCSASSCRPCANART